MGDPKSARETVHGDPIDHPSDRFSFRSQLSIAMIGVFALGGTLGVAMTASRLDPARAIYDASIGSWICAIVMVVCWGASDGHAKLARIACRGHERVVEILTRRLDGIEEIERETGNAVVIALDEVRKRRSQRNG
jgi:hypothetical protein